MAALRYALTASKHHITALSKQLQDLQQQNFVHLQEIRTLRKKQKEVQAERDHKDGGDNERKAGVSGSPDTSDAQLARERELADRISLLTRERRKLSFALASAKDHIIRLTGRLALGSDEAYPKAAAAKNRTLAKGSAESQARGSVIENSTFAFSSALYGVSGSHGSNLHNDSEGLDDGDKGGELRGAADEPRGLADALPCGREEALHVPCTADRVRLLIAGPDRGR